MVHRTLSPRTLSRGALTRDSLGLRLQAQSRWVRLPSLESGEAVEGLDLAGLPLVLDPPVWLRAGSIHIPPLARAPDCTVRSSGRRSLL